jgi:hypothetical protein
MDDREHAVALQGAARLKGQAALLRAQADEQTELMQAPQLQEDRQRGADEQLHAEQAHATAAVAGHWVPEPVLHALCSFAMQWNPHVTWPSLRELLLLIHQVRTAWGVPERVACMEDNLLSDGKRTSAV